MELLGKLVDKSLVWVDQGVGAEARYRMLETIRQYAHEKLHEMGGEEAVRDRHLVYFLGMAEGAEPRLRHEDGAIWMDRLEMELDNLRLALEWSLAGGSAGEAGRRAASRRARLGKAARQWEKQRPAASHPEMEGQGWTAFRSRGSRRV